MDKLSAFETAKLIIKNTNDDYFGAARIVVLSVLPTLSSKKRIIFWNEVREEIFNIKHGKT